MPRFVTFRFDDGFLNGARKATAFLYPDPATFFLISDLVENTTLGREPLFRGKDFGTLAAWQELSAQGHDIQLHSATHPLFTQISVARQIQEVQTSLAFIQRIHGGPYVFCYPYNTLTQLDLGSLGVSAAGFESQDSQSDVLCNHLNDGLDLFQLKGWAVRERHFDRVIEQLAENVPDSSWTILGFHSLDDEGHEPWSSQKFSELVGAVRTQGYTIESVSGMLHRESRRSASRSSTATS